MEVKVYKAEHEAGIGELVAKGSISFASAIVSSSIRTQLVEERMLEQFKKTVASANPDQIDLCYKHSILASVGWNKNDTVFDPVETWLARHTATDKQLNLEHNEFKIVGHMTDDYVVDSNGQIIPDDTQVENIPETFDLISQFVIYKFWEDEARRNEIEQIINEIDVGQWFVSMECRFPKFDYALIDSKGLHKTVARTEETAFLTKYLRKFNGPGEYKGHKIGYIPRNLFFTGQGIVSKPANERSIIFDFKDKIAFKSQGSIIIRENKMDEKQVAELQAQLASAKAEVERIKSEQASSKVTEVTENLAKANAAKVELDKALAKANEQITEKDKVIASLTDEVKTANEKRSVAETEIAALKAEAIKTSRASKLASVGISADKIEATLTKWESLNDAQFNEIAEMYKKPEEKKEDKKEKASESKETPDLSKAELEAKASLNQDENKPNRMQSLGAFLTESLPYSATASQRLNKKN